MRVGVPGGPPCLVGGRVTYGLDSVLVFSAMLMVGSHKGMFSLSGEWQCHI